MNIALVFAWLTFLIIGWLTVVIAYQIGDRLVHTHAGVDRTGPLLGEEIDVAKLQVLSSDLPKLIVFSGQSTELLEDFLFEIEKFADDMKDALEIIIISKISGADDSALKVSYAIQLPESYETETKHLTIRVSPFALLLNPANTLIAKGLVNTYQDLCLLIRSGDEYKKHDYYKLYERCACEQSNVVHMQLKETNHES